MAGLNEKRECPICGCEKGVLDPSKVNTFLMEELFPAFLHDFGHALHVARSDSNSILRFLYRGLPKNKRNDEKIKNFHNDLDNSFELVVLIMHIHASLFRDHNDFTEVKNAIEISENLLALHFSKYIKIRSNFEDFSSEKKYISAKYPLILFVITRRIVTECRYMRYPEVDFKLDILNKNLITSITSHSYREKYNDQRFDDILKSLIVPVSGELDCVLTNSKLHIAFSLPLQDR